MTNPRTIVAIGKTGEGKSAVLNSILRSNGVCDSLFEERASINSVTKEIVVKSTEVDGAAVTLVDTVGLFDSDDTAPSNEKRSLQAQATHTILDEHAVVLEKLSTVMQLSPQGIDGFLVVIDTTRRATRELKQTLEIIITYFGRQMLQYCVFVFTKIDISDTPQSEWEPCVEGILESIGYPCSLSARCVFVSNRETDMHKAQHQVDQLFNAVHYNVIREQRPYTNIFFQEAQQEIRREKERLKAEYDRQVQAQLEEQTRQLQIQQQIQMEIQRKEQEKEMQRLQEVRRVEEERLRREHEENLRREAENRRARERQLEQERQRVERERKEQVARQEEVLRQARARQEQLEREARQAQADAEAARRRRRSNDCLVI